MRGATLATAVIGLALAACGGGTAGTTTGGLQPGGSGTTGGLGLGASGGSTGLSVGSSSGGTGHATTGSSSSAGTSRGSTGESTAGSGTSSSGGTSRGSTSGGSTGTADAGGTTGSADAGGTTGAADAGGTTGSADAGGGGGTTGGNGGLADGSRCFQGVDCASGLCKPVIENQSVCVSPCSSQSDCPGDAGAFCEPLSAGASSGYCVPPSPTACASCTGNLDCGRLSEACIADPSAGNVCAPDCSLSGPAGCPPAYDCQAVTVDGGSRRLCLPQSGSCASAPGGSCALASAAENCEQTSSAGSCTGQRTCQSDGWYSTCSAPAPQLLPDCSSTAPSGCTESLAPSAIDTVQNCGSCGNACPGAGLATDVVTCNASLACTFACAGENYDVNGNPADGCEVTASPQGNHTQGANVYLGSYGSCDQQIQVNGANVGGVFPSDARVHQSPAVAGFDPATGSAPDWWSVFGTGSGALCLNDFQAELVVSNSKFPGCYQLTASTNQGTWSSPTDPASGTAFINQGDSSNYSDNTTIYLFVSKTCSTTDSDAPIFSFPTLHL